MASQGAHDIPEVPFTAGEASAGGLTRGDLRGRTVNGVSRGLYRPCGWDFDLRDAARALCAATPGAWISHSTAARLHDLALPPWLAASNELHFSKGRNLPQIRRKGITGHRVTSYRDEVEIDGALHISTRARTWLDLARTLSLDDLVCMGDQLIRIPRPEFEDRKEPYATLESLRALVGRHRNLQGIVRAREALELMRVGADSPPETLLRLAMLDAGLPEPELQIKLWNGRGAPSADAGYQSRRIALQYDGAHHLDEEQRHSDQRRDKAFEAAGWTVLIFTEADLADRFDTAVRRIKTALRHAWTDPAIASGFASGT
jgi:very-short-patch-repair endonuclease